MTAAVAPRRSPSVTTDAERATAPRRAPAARPQLHVLDQAALRRRARRRNTLTVAFVVVLAGFFLVAFVHATLVASQQDLDLMRTRLAELEAEKAQVERQIEESSAPSRIVERAAELGMVRAEDPVFLMAVRNNGTG
jgi:cell division protein FtsL